MGGLMSQQRNTLQRTIVLETLRKLGNHPTIEELHAKIQEDYPAIIAISVENNPDGTDSHERSNVESVTYGIDLKRNCYNLSNSIG
jgi:hypothetical protein